MGSWKNLYNLRMSTRAVKTIEYVDIAPDEAADPTAPFLLRRFDQATFRQSATDVPHRHNYHEIFVVQAGHGKHAIDGHASDIGPCSVSLITKGQVHLVEYLTDLMGWLIRFDDDFLPAGFTSQAWNYHATLFNQLGRPRTLFIDRTDYDALGLVLDLIESEWAQPDAFQQHDVLRHLLSVLIVRLERIYQNALSTNQHEREEYRVYQHFMSLLDDRFTRYHDVQHYATTLQITPVRLSRLLGRIMGRSTKQMIDERIVLEAKRFLHYTDLSITEIAAALGYSDQFHFSKTFKRLTGLAPQAFREQRQKLT